MVIQDQGAASPVRIPVVLVIEIEDVGTQLPGAVAMRRDRAAGRCVVPMEVQAQRFDAQHAAQQVAIDGPLEFFHERLPGLGQFWLPAPLQDIAIMAGLSIETPAPEGFTALFHRWQAAAQVFVSFRRDELLDGKPGIGLGLLEIGRIKL